MGLPSYRRLFEKKYRYKASCSLCHIRGGGSQFNDYGKYFLRLGANIKAFLLLEKKDTDRDGSLNLEEIQAKSNPGDPRSTPEKPGDWLSRIEEDALPLKQLKQLFPGIKKFSTLEGMIYKEHVSIIEKSLGEELLDEDKVPTFYFAIEKKKKKLKRVGVALFVSSTKKKKDLITALGIDLKGKITKVLLVKNKVDKSLSKKEFLEQFIGKTVKDDFKVGEDLTAPVKEREGSAQLVATTVKKGLLTIHVVFTKPRKRPVP